MSLRCNVQFLAILLLYTISARKSSEAASVQFNFLRVDGLPLHVYSDESEVDFTKARYRIVAKECRAGICSTMGILNPNRMFTTLYTAEGLEDKDMFSIAIRLRRLSAPVISDWAISEAASPSPAALEQLENGEIRQLGLSGSGEEIDIDLKRRREGTDDSLVSEYVMETSIAELKRCREKCVFSSNYTDEVLSEPKQPVRISADQSALHVSFKLMVHEDASSAKPTTNSRLAAAFFEGTILSNGA
jgi:hypothetical protein